MMGSRGAKGGDEHDAFSQRARRIFIRKAGKYRAAKTKFWRRTRRKAKAGLKHGEPV